MDSFCLFFCVTLVHLLTFMTARATRGIILYNNNDSLDIVGQVTLDHPQFFYSKMVQSIAIYPIPFS